MTPVQTTIQFNRQVSSTSWHLRLQRDAFDFRAGELITLYGRDRHACRDYSVASGEQDDYIDIIYRKVDHGALTPELVTLQAGESLDISGPTGTFILRDIHRPVVFIATGTGIAPCRAYLRSHPELDLTLIHGVRDEEDLYFREQWTHCAYFPCLTTTEPVRPNHFQGRLTAFLPSWEHPDNAQFYLCGANEMIYEVEDLLQKAGIAAQDIFHEPYYYRWDD